MACPRLSLGIILLALLPYFHVNFEVEAQSKDVTNNQLVMEQPQGSSEHNPQKRAALETPSVQDPNSFSEVDSFPKERDTAAQPADAADSASNSDYQDDRRPQKREADAAKPASVGDTKTAANGEDKGPLSSKAVESRQIDFYDDDDITTYPLTSSEENPVLYHPPWPPWKPWPGYKSYPGHFHPPWPPWKPWPGYNTGPMIYHPPWPPWKPWPGHYYAPGRGNGRPRPLPWRYGTGIPTPRPFSWRDIRPTTRPPPVRFYDIRPTTRPPPWRYADIRPTTRPPPWRYVPPPPWDYYKKK